MLKIFTKTTINLGAAFILALLISSATTFAQGQHAANVAPDVRGTRIAVTGDATVQAQPDTAIITIAVITQSRTALAAQTANATKSDTMIRALKAVAGAGAEVKTSGYSIQPQYTYAPNQTPTIKGYEARNSVTVTLNDLTKVGATIDAASQAGANDVDNLSFTLRHDRSAREQALTEATRAALAKAQTLAQALGGRVVRIIEVREASASRPPIVPLQEYAMKARASASTPTPVEVGSLDVRSEVELVAEVEIR